MILWNVHSFYRMYAKDPVTEDIANGQAPQVSHALDKWVLSRLASTHKTVTESLDTYNTPAAGRAIQDFITELSTWYTRRSRDRIKEGNEDAQQALRTLGFVLVETSKLLAPFMPFIAEHFYKDLTGKLSVHLEKWSDMRDNNPTLEASMASLQNIVEMALRIRKENNIKVRQPLATLQYLSPEGIELDDSMEQIIAEELNVKTVTKVTELVSRTGWASVNGQVALDLVLTPELEKEGLARELERQVQDLRKKSGLKIGELVDLYFTTQDPDLAEIATNFLDRKKTFINQVKTSLEIEADYEIQATVDGKPIWLGLVII
jgi:isoleucyl-tRNA synthetase